MAKAPAKSSALATATPETKAGLPALAEDARGIIESVLIRGDLSKMTPEQRTDYYLRVCNSVGLNPLTKPFEYITLNSKLTLYALRGCTDQLRAIHKVSVLEEVETERDGVFIVTTKVQNGEGRTDVAKGAVNIQGLKGEALANALMKAETKAKRRATLSICGLGFLDETEVEDIPEKQIQRVPSPSEARLVETEAVEAAPEPQKPSQARSTKVEATKEQPAKDPATEPQNKDYPNTTPREIDVKGMSKDQFCAAYIKAVGLAKTAEEIKQWRELNKKPLALAETKFPEVYERIVTAEQQATDNLSAPSSDMGAVEISGDLTDRVTEMPDVETDTDAFVQKAIEVISTFKDAQAAQDWINEIVEPVHDKLFPPDYNEIIAAYERLEQKLAP